MSLRGHRIGSAAQVLTERYLIVTMASRKFALPAESVHGLLTLEECGTVGTMTVQGQEYSFVDLAGRLGLSQDGDGPETRIVLLAHAGICGCIRVDQVQGLLEIDRAQVLALPHQFRSEERNWYVGLMVVGDSVAAGLNSLWLLRGTSEASHGLRAQGQSVPHVVHAVPNGREKGLAC